MNRKKMQKTYYAVITHAKGDDDFWVMFPEVNCCFSRGDTVEQAIANAHEALELHLYALQGNYPEHIAFADLKPDLGDGGDYVVTIVPITVPVQGRTFWVNTTLDEHIVSALNKVTKNLSENCLNKKKASVMEVTYNAFFYKETAGGYSAVFPDIPQGATHGATLDKAIYMAQDFLKVALQDVAKEDLPKPTPLEKALTQQNQENNQDGYDGELVFAISITTQIPPHKVKISTTLDRQTVSALDKITKNRSAFLKQAVKEKIASM